MKASIRQTVFACTFTVVAASCGTKEEQKPALAPVKVTVQEITATSRPQELRYPGTIDPDNTANIGFAVAGVINNVAVQEGDHVGQGQLLATVDATEYANALAIANAGLEQAQDMYKRLEGLYKKGSLPEKDFIEIKTKVAQATANKSINAKHIADSRLYAPMSGIVTAKLIERGSTAAPGIPAFTIIKTDQVYVRISIPESEVGSIKKGMQVMVSVPTLGDSLSGTVSIINPQADANSKTYNVKVRLNNAGGTLLPGMIAQTFISTGKNMDGISIPASSVVRDANDITYVFVVTSDKKAIRKRITTNAAVGNNEVLVKDGLAPGDKLVIAGQTRLKDGTLVSY